MVEKYPKVPKNFLRLGIPYENRFFKAHSKLYGGVSVRAHILETFPKAVSLLLATIQKPYFIDPMTYVFAREPGELKNKKNKLRHSYNGLKEHYGSLVKESVGKRALQPSDFLSNKIIDDFSSSVISYQHTRVQNLVKEFSKGLEEYLPEHWFDRPTMSVAPYFYACDVNDPWYDVSLKLAKSSSKFKGDSLLFPVVCIGKDALLDEDVILKIRGDYDYNGFDGYMLWIPRLSESEEEIGILKGLKNLTTQLGETKKPIYNLAGGYFSILLSYFGLSGFVSGIGYGESRDVIVSKGGPIQVRYYIPIAHTSRRPTDVERLFKQYPELMCRCTVCASMKVDEISRINDDKAKEHFLYVRTDEIEYISKHDKTTVINRLQKEYDENKDKLSLLDITHLSKWIKAISE